MLNRPLQETDLLLHEAGVPPLHTLFKELEKLPSRVKKRMYVVHSSKIPEEFDLRKAPTGTAGTLRLDALHKDGAGMARCGVSMYANANANNLARFEGDEVNSPWDSAGSEYVKVEGGSQDQSDAVPSSNKGNIGRNSMIASGRRSVIPLVSLRPTSNTDSWYMLNLLQAVPFLTRYVSEYACTLRLDFTGWSHSVPYLPISFFLYIVYLIHLRWKYWSQLESRPLIRTISLCQRLVETRYCVSFGKVHASNVD